MTHPFDFSSSELEAMDLDFEQQLTDEEAAQVGGGRGTGTTRAIGKEGGNSSYSRKPKPLKPKRPSPSRKPPEVTTEAIGEEGGDLIFTTLALGEEGGCFCEE